MSKVRKIHRSLLGYGSKFWLEVTRVLHKFSVGDLYSAGRIADMKRHVRTIIRFVVV